MPEHDNSSLPNHQVYTESKRFYKQYFFADHDLNFLLGKKGYVVVVCCFMISISCCVYRGNPLTAFPETEALRFFHLKSASQVFREVHTIQPSNPPQTITCRQLRIFVYNTLSLLLFSPCLSFITIFIWHTTVAHGWHSHLVEWVWKASFDMRWHLPSCAIFFGGCFWT